MTMSNARLRSARVAAIQADDSQPESGHVARKARGGVRAAAWLRHWSPALVAVSGTMCVSEQKQKKLSAPFVGRRGGMGACGVPHPASPPRARVRLFVDPRAAPTFQFHSPLTSAR